MWNLVKVGVLLTALTGVLVLIGKLIGGPTGMVIALVIAVAINMGSYWFSDKLVIKMTGAQPVSPSQAPELHEMLERLSKNAGIPKPSLYLVDDPTPNAFATGRNPQKGVVALNTGLLRLLNSEEVEGVIAHELAHIKHRDTLTMAVVASVAGGIMLIADFLRIFAIFGGGSDEDSPNPIVLIGMSIVAPLAAMLIQMAISRAREFEADASGAKIAGNPNGLASALKKLEQSHKMPATTHATPATAHMYIINPLSGGGSLLNLFRTHPTTDQRIARLMNMRRDMRLS